MRKTHKIQLTLTEPWLDLQPAQELKAISNLLDEHPKINRLIWQDLGGTSSPSARGAQGLSAEQVLRALVLKQMHGFSYRDLHFHLNDSRTYQGFCRLGLGDNVPSKSVLASTIKRVRPETLEAVNRVLIDAAVEKQIETGKKARVDCTVVESNIHKPTDSSLLWDAVRVLTRVMGQIQELLGPEVISFNDRTRRAKRRYRAAEDTKHTKDRKAAYRDLLRVSEEVYQMALRVRQLAAEPRELDLFSELMLHGLLAELDRFLPLTVRVLDQTRRRVLEGEQVSAEEKIVSIFEDHTDIICKDRRDTFYGHKICLSGGESMLILDCMILDGNPADATLAEKMVVRHQEIFSKPPRQVAFDGCFASRANLNAIKDHGVKDVAFTKGRGLQVTEMVKSSWVYQKLRRFRAGVEAHISFLKRAFGLTRCTWRSLQSFHSYVWGSIVACNLLVMARHVLA